MTDTNDNQSEVWPLSLVLIYVSQNLVPPSVRHIERDTLNAATSRRAAAGSRHVYRVNATSTRFLAARCRLALALFAVNEASTRVVALLWSLLL